MNLGVTIARKGDKWEVITDPNTSFAEQRREFGDVCEVLEKTHDEVLLLSKALGCVRRKKLKAKSGVASLEVLSVLPANDDLDEENQAPAAKPETKADTTGAGTDETLI